MASVSVAGAGERVSGPSRTPKRSVVAGGVGSISRPRGVSAHLAAQRVDAERGDGAAAAHEASQALLQRRAAASACRTAG